MKMKKYYFRGNKGAVSGLKFVERKDDKFYKDDYAGRNGCVNTHASERLENKGYNLWRSTG